MLTRFLAVLIGAVVLLATLNLLPAWLGGEPRGVVRYASLTDLERRYHVRLSAPADPPVGPVRLSVARPGWLAFDIQAPADAESGPITVCQTLAPVADGDPVQIPEALLPAGESLQASEVPSADRRAQLRRVMLADGTLVTELWWRERGRHVMLRGQGDAGRLVRLFDRVTQQAR